MTSTGQSFFDQFLNDYFAESEEHLASARSIMLSIESAGSDRTVDPNVLDELLRNFHSLKGLSAMVGLEEATQLAHHIEDYLRELKRPFVTISAEGIERIVAGIAGIEKVVDSKRRSEPPPDVGVLLLHLQAATEEVRTKPESSPKHPANVWRFVFKSSEERAKQGLTVNTVRERLRAIGDVLQATPQIGSDGKVAFEFFVAVKVPESAFENLPSQGIEYSRVAPNSPVSSPSKEEPIGERDAPRAVSQNVIRVEMSRLDDLMRVAGDLVISRFRLDEALSKLNGSGNSNELQEINTSLERQLRELREGIVRIRMVPIGQVFERMRFVVRGLVRELNKAVELHIGGEETEIDKVIVDRIMDPLLHLVRNAISHGLESPEERIAAGKPAIGQVRLSAKTAGDIILIEVEDDGRGIDSNTVLSRARTLGWIGKNESADSQRLLEIISAPGFTTRDKADTASGRGIGMAAVKSAVSDLGGSIDLATTERKGTRFTIRLPLTLLIADSLMVSVGNQRFAVLQTAVREVLAVESSKVKALENNEVIPFRGAVLPLRRLADVFGIRAPVQERLHVLVILNGDNPMGLAVDRITGQREIVVRTVTDPLLRVPGVVGATELGDGRPVLIIDPYSVISTNRKIKSMGTPS